MNIKEILSAENAYIKKLAKLKTRKYREEYGLFITEGERSCREAVSSGFNIESLIMTKAFYEAHKGAFSAPEIIVTTEKIFAALSDTKSPQGVLCVAEIPKATALCKGKYIYLDSVQDPGNAGTIIRSADAFGFDGVLVSSGSVDVFSPKVIRSSMGSVFHIDILLNQDIEDLQSAQENGYHLTATALAEVCVNLGDMKVLDKQIFIVGNEANGVSDAVLMLSDEIVKIPMRGAAESLNVGVAASILMYEVSRHE